MRLARTRTPSFTRVFARLTSTAATLTGVLLALTIVFPSVRPVDILSGAGVLTSAAGFAFQDILQNLLAGLLPRFATRSVAATRSGSRPDRHRQEVNIRETVISTFDGRRILIPDAEVYTGVIAVQTARERIRSSFVVGVAYETDLAEAR